MRGYRECCPTGSASWHRHSQEIWSQYTQQTSTLEASSLLDLPGGLSKGDSSVGNFFSCIKSLGAILLWNTLGIRIKVERRRRFPWPGKDKRFDYQKCYVQFDIQPGDHVLDVGSGGDPFPYATVLTDRFLDKSPYRFEPLVRDTKPFLVSDIY